MADGNPDKDSSESSETNAHHDGDSSNASQGGTRGGSARQEEKSQPPAHATTNVTKKHVHRAVTLSTGILSVLMAGLAYYDANVVDEQRREIRKLQEHVAEYNNLLEARLKRMGEENRNAYLQFIQLVQGSPATIAPPQARAIHRLLSQKSISTNQLLDWARRQGIEVSSVEGLNSLQAEEAIKWLEKQ